MASSATVYVIDDDASFLKAATRLIRMNGYTVVGMNSLGELRSKLPITDHACVLADIMLDGESGLEADEIMRAAGCRTPIVFMTANDEIDRLTTADFAGSVPCLRKPFEAGELFAALEAALKPHPITSIQFSTPERTPQ